MIQPLDPDEEDKTEKLNEDYASPFSLPDDIPDSVKKDDPRLDDPIDSQEAYDDGLLQEED